MTTFMRWRLIPLVTLAAIVLAGCMQSQIDANNRQLAQQEAQLDQLKQQVEVLQNQGAQSSYNTSPPSPNACDSAVMREAARKGGERMTAGDPVKAVGYYQDAVTACPSSAEAQLNLAHADELIGDRAGALEALPFGGCLLGSQRRSGCNPKGPGRHRPPRPLARALILALWLFSFARFYSIQSIENAIHCGEPKPEVYKRSAPHPPETAGGAGTNCA